MKLYYKNLQDKLAINLSMQYDGHLKMGGSVGRQAGGLIDRCTDLYRNWKPVWNIVLNCPGITAKLFSQKCIKGLKLDFIIFEQGV